MSVSMFGSHMWDIHEPLLNKINSLEAGRTAEGLYRRRRNTEDNRKTEIVEQKKMRIVLTINVTFLK